MANIMVADDSDAIRLVLRDILAIGKHSVVAEAVNKKDGLTVLKEIIEKNPQAKVILITASDDQKIITQCLQIGAVSCISKPFDFNDVLKQINASLE
jgi:two-component system chemotaxis response regulator CheY